MFAFILPSLNPVKYATVINYLCHTCVWWFLFSLCLWFFFFLIFFLAALAVAALLFAFCSGLEFSCRPQTKKILLMKLSRLVLIDTRLLRNLKETNFAFILHLAKWNIVGKTYNYTSVVLSKTTGFHKAHTEKSIILLFSSFKALMLYSSPDISKFISTRGL